MKIIPFASIAVFLLAFSGGANAREYKDPNAGYFPCAKGTCADNGGPMASHAGHCKASNCRGGANMGGKK
jgi:hypothetical protein